MRTQWALAPEGLEDYWQVIDSSDRFMGGCIWEWADHAIDHEGRKIKYTYGGDHGEPFHDGNFCVDGLVFPDRTPSSGALNMKQVYPPCACTILKAARLSLGIQIPSAIQDI